MLYLEMGLGFFFLSWKKGLREADFTDNFYSSLFHPPVVSSCNTYVAGIISIDFEMHPVQLLILSHRYYCLQGRRQPEKGLVGKQGTL